MWVEESPLIRAPTLTFGKKWSGPILSSNTECPCEQQELRSVSNTEAASLGNHKYCKKHCQGAFIFHMFPQLIGLSPPNLLS